MPTDEDWAFFHHCEEGFHVLYEGKWILIHQGRLKGIYDRMDQAFAAASGLGHCLIQHIGPEPPPRDLNASPPEK